MHFIQTFSSLFLQLNFSKNVFDIYYKTVKSYLIRVLYKKSL